MTSDELQMIMAEIGPLDDAMTGVARLAETVWGVEFADDSRMF